MWFGCTVAPDPASDQLSTLGGALAAERRIGV